MYARLKGGALQVLVRIPHVSNASAEQLAAYAIKQGYRYLVLTPCPGPDYRSAFTETGEAILQCWEQVLLWYRADPSADGIYREKETGIRYTLTVSDEYEQGLQRMETLGSFLNLMQLELVPPDEYLEL